MSISDYLQPLIRNVKRMTSVEREKIAVNFCLRIVRIFGRSYADLSEIPGLVTEETESSMAFTFAGLMGECGYRAQQTITKCCFSCSSTKKRFGVTSGFEFQERIVPPPSDILSLTT